MSSAEVSKSSLGAVWMSNKTHGNSSSQFGPNNRACNADLGYGNTPPNNWLVGDRQ